VPTLIKERYELLETLGVGGEGHVVKALDRQHNRFVALKIRSVRDGQEREELLNEARILLAVPPHPALPLVREDFFDGEDYVVAMDWVDGTDLATLLRDRGRPGLAASSVLAYLAQAAEALTHLHSQTPAVIHGDVKPGNLILTRGGRVKLVDFGMSSAPNALRRRIGTPGYRAPELALDGAPSRASDVFALAATAFALLTGSAPAGVLPRWEGIDPAQAEQLEAGMRLGMATDPSRRLSTPGELIERLRAGWAESMPTGVITFCLSDIEGSAAMWDTEPAAMAEALVRHDELIADCVAAHGGRWLKSTGEGDSTVSVFDSAPQAVSAALAAAHALSAEAWPGALRVVARFGIHTGEAERRGTDYLGPSINLAARLRGQADGGQIFLSEVTAGLVGRHLPEGCALVDLGPHRLHGLAAAEQIYALKGPGVSAPFSATECPYRGLLAFEPGDRNYFFGREAVVEELIGRLAPGRLLAVVGASGSGKSSVLRAGVLGAVRAGDVAGIERGRLLTPGSSEQLDAEDAAGQLVVVDQFEEIFLAGSDADRRQAFIDVLLALPCRVAVSVRADMYGKLGGHPALARAVAGNQVLLGAMTDAELERAVKEPARLAGLRLETGLVELVMRDVAGEPGALPLLSHALRATWERRDGRTLTVEGYRQSGGVGAAIAQTADSLFESLSPERGQMMRSMFLRLTELGEGVAESRRRVRIGELVPEGVSPAVIDELLGRLAEARLVTLGEGTAQVAHEVLIREWPTLRGWLDEDREGLRLHRQIGDATRLWDAGGRGPADLYRGARLDAAADWARTHRGDLNASERAFIDASVDGADRARRVQLRSNRRLRGLLAGAVILLVIAVLAGVVSFVQRGHAQAQALTSDAERIGAQALTEPNVDRSLLLAAAGVKLQNRLETRSDLLADLQKNPALIRLIRPTRSEITALRVSPDGRLLAVADAAGAVRFIDLASWKPRGAEVRLRSPVAERAMSFSPDSRRLVVLSVGVGRSELDVIDVIARRARRIQAWRGPAPQAPIGFEAVAYSPDGAHIAVTRVTEPGFNGPTAVQLFLLTAATGRTRWHRRYPLSRGQGDAHIAFTSTGALLTSAQQGATILWDPRSGRILRQFPLGGVPAVASNGRHVALGLNNPFVGTPSSSVAVLDLRTGSHHTLPANLPDAWIRSLAFTPDGAQLVGASQDGVHVWDLASGAIAETYVAQAGPRSLATLDPSGRTVISGQQDGSIAAFDLSGGRRLGRAFRWNKPMQACGFTPCFAVNRQSELMATDQGDGSVAIIDLRTLRLVRTLPARNGATSAAITFLPDGRTLVTGGTNRLVTLWDLSTGRVTRTLRFADPVWWTAASPDGKLLAVQTQAVGDPDTHVEVVQIATGKVLQIHTVRHGPNGVAFTRDGRELVALGCCWSGSGSTLVAWDTRSSRQLFSPGRDVSAAAFDLSPNSRLLGVGTGDGKLLLLDARTGRQTAAPIQVAAGIVSQVAFSPDGHSFAVASNDHTASLWDLRSHKRLGNTFGPFRGTVPAVSFEPNGRLLIDLLANAVEWPTDVRTWERYACRAAGRDLTRAEWHDLTPNRAYHPVCPA
jgi:WD40 repeat protein/class 3 adenylate cyclase